MTTKTLTAGRPSTAKQSIKDLMQDEPATAAKVRMNFEIDKEDHKQLKLLATTQDTTISNLLRDAVRKLVRDAKAN